MVIDPAVSAETAGILRANAHLLSKIRLGWRPEPVAKEHARRNPSSLVLLLATPPMIALVTVLMESRVAPAGFVVLGAFVVLVLVRMAAFNESPPESRIHERVVYERARWHEGRYLLPEDFDTEAQAILGRAQEAIGTVLRSHVNAEGLLDDVRNAIMLPAQEWEIARLLAKLSSLRTEHRALLGRGVTAEVAEAVAPLERALDSSEAAVLARVEALEGYARHVAEAEAAYHARGQIEELRARLPRYEELLAESGADALAVPEIERLAEDAGHLEQALRRSVTSAHEAFRHLEG
ncbi:hypothetical protein ACIBEJ_03905 [Nonomuraea sp. NPDC050790]|uniref:hypothetical protein n=1 Tax=Nonomuraea sp. NPDC050790 TaxID=3364371 RepID=UPI0037A34C79